MNFRVPGEYSRTPVARTLKGNKKQFESEGNSSSQGKFQWNFDQGKENSVRVSGEFELSEFELSRFYCGTDPKGWLVSNESYWGDKVEYLKEGAVDIPLFWLFAVSVQVCCEGGSYCTWVWRSLNPIKLGLSMVSGTFLWYRLLYVITTYAYVQLNVHILTVWWMKY